MTLLRMVQTAAGLLVGVVVLAHWLLARTVQERNDARAALAKCRAYASELLIRAERAEARAAELEEGLPSATVIRLIHPGGRAS